MRWGVEDGTTVVSAATTVVSVSVELVALVRLAMDASSTDASVTAAFDVDRIPAVIMMNDVGR